MLSYIGGKFRIGKWIVDYIPNDIETYVEPFGGMFWVFFNMDLKKYSSLKTVVYNDFNSLNSNFYACLKNPKEFLEVVDSIPVQEFKSETTDPIYKEKFLEFQKEIFSDEFKYDGTPNYLVGAKYAYIVAQVFSGSKPETSNFIDLKGKYRSKYLSFRDRLASLEYQEMFERITYVENSDFEALIGKYDHEKTFFYIDPPYWKTENYYSNHEFDRADHERLSNVCKSMKGRFCISYYHFTLLEEWFPRDHFKWEQKEFSKAAAAKKGVKQNKGMEVLIMNY